MLVHLSFATSNAGGDHPVLRTNSSHRHDAPSPVMLLPGASTVPPRPGSFDALDIDASMRSFVFAASRLRGCFQDSTDFRSADLVELERSSGELRTLLQSFLADLGAAADRLDEQGSKGVCSILDRLLGGILRIERILSIFEFSHLGGVSSFFCFSTISWLQSYISMSYHIPVEERAAQYAASPRPEVLLAPRMDDMDSQIGVPASSSVFWDDIYRLVVRGRLSDAWSLLQLHSELRSVVEYTSSSEDRRSLALLRDLFLLHPVPRVEEALAARKRGMLAASQIEAILDVYTKEWSRWHALVERLRSDPHCCPLAARVPQLHKLICLLTGDNELMLESAFKYGTGEWSGDSSVTAACWRSLALMELLYSAQNAPPCSKAVTSNVLERALTIQYGDTWPETVADSADDASVAQCLMGVLKGNIYAPLRYLYELSVQSPVSEYAVRSAQRSGDIGAEPGESESSLSDADAAATATTSFGIVALGSFAHLLLLLDKSEVLPLTSSKPLQGNKSCGAPDDHLVLEEIIIEFATKLNFASFPVEVILNYLSHCPNLGRACAAVLIPQRIFVDDVEAETASHALRRLSLFDEADEVDSRRGMLWIRKGMKIVANTLPPLESKVSLLTCFLGCYSKSKRSSLALVKAARYFIGSSNQSHLVNVFEAAWQSCVVSFYVTARAALKTESSSLGFDGMPYLLKKSFASLSLCDIETIRLDDPFTSTVIAGIKLCESFLLDTEKTVEGRLRESLYSLQRTLENVKLLFDIISYFNESHSTFERKSSPSVSAFFICFVRYVEAIELVVACLMPNALPYLEARNSFAKASRLLFGIMCESPGHDNGSLAFESAVPSRHFTHLLDTCVWMCEAMLPILPRAIQASPSPQSSGDDAVQFGTILSRSQLDEIMRIQSFTREMFCSAPNFGKCSSTCVIDSVGSRILRLVMNSVIVSNKTLGAGSESSSSKTNYFTFDITGTSHGPSHPRDFQVNPKVSAAEVFFHAC